jgi:reactive intermediate/imine deaminase
LNTIINPPELVPPIGYSHAISSNGGKTIYLAGQVAFDSTGNIIHKGDIEKQFDQALHNLEAVLSAAGGQMNDIVKLTIFVTDKNEYGSRMKEIGRIYQTYFGKYFPAMTLVEVSSLFEDDAMLEIEGIAVIHS